MVGTIYKIIPLNMNFVESRELFVESNSLFNFVYFTV